MSVPNRLTRRNRAALVHIKLSELRRKKRIKLDKFHSSARYWGGHHEFSVKIFGFPVTSLVALATCKKGEKDHESKTIVPSISLMIGSMNRRNKL